MFAYIGIALCTCCLPGAEASAQEQAEQRKVEPASEVAIGAKWGRPVAGLQAGMRLASGSTRVLVGDRVKLHLVLRNTTDRAIRVAWANNQGRYGWRVRRTGKTASDHVWAIAPRYRYWQEERLVPPVAGAIGFRLGARSETAIPMEGPELLVTDHIESKAGATTVVGKPGGIIRLRALPITAAARGEEWLDQLETGELTLQVVASETEAPAQAPKRAWSPEQATGEPDTPQAGDYPTAWASLTRDDQDEWLMLEYAEPVVPTEVRVHETYNPGALNKVSVFTEEGREVVLWTGEDPTPVGNDKGVSKTALRPGALRFRTKRVKLYLASRAVPGWNEIDAVALVGRTADRSERVQWAAAATASSTYAENAAGEPGGQLGGPTVEQRAEATVPSRVGAAAPAEPRVWETRSCKICKSVQEIEAVASDILFSMDLVRIVGKDWVWTYRGKGCETCAHQWQRGVSRSVGPIRDGTVVLVRKGQVYGAFMIERQRQRPEEASYVWAYGADGRRPLDAADPEATRSSSPATTVDRHGERRVEFGPFSVEWSAGPSSSGWGWLYYPRAPGDPLTEDDVAICVTDAESFHGIRPADSRWVYRRSPVEPAPDAPPTGVIADIVPF
jgi:hypothetical protein